jgi:hypothetical protein
VFDSERGLHQCRDDLILILLDAGQQIPAVGVSTTLGNGDEFDIQLKDAKTKRPNVPGASKRMSYEMADRREGRGQTPRNCTGTRHAPKFRNEETIDNPMDMSAPMPSEPRGREEDWRKFC